MNHIFFILFWQYAKYLLLYEKEQSEGTVDKPFMISTLQIYTVENGTHVKSVKVTSICHRYYHVKV